MMFRTQQLDQLISGDKPCPVYTTENKSREQMKREGDSGRGVKGCFGTPEQKPPTSDNGRPTTRTAMVKSPSLLLAVAPSPFHDHFVTLSSPNASLTPSARFVSACEQLAMRREKEMSELAATGERNATPTMPVGVKPGAPGKNPGVIDSYGVNSMRKFQHTDVEIYLKRPLRGT